MPALARLQMLAFGALAAIEWPVVVFAVSVTIDAAFVTAVFTGVLATIGLLISSRTLIVANRTQKEVKTINSVTLGRASDLAGKRRIEEDQDAGRPVTQEDVQHVRDVNAAELDEAKHAEKE